MLAAFWWCLRWPGLPRPWPAQRAIPRFSKGFRVSSFDFLAPENAIFCSPAGASVLVLVRIGTWLSKYWNIHWRLPASLSIACACSTVHRETVYASFRALFRLCLSQDMAPLRVTGHVRHPTGRVESSIESRVESRVWSVAAGMWRGAGVACARWRRAPARHNADKYFPFRSLMIYTSEDSLTEGGASPT